MTANKKYFRKRYNELNSLKTEELLSLYEKPHTDVDDEAILKILANRKAAVPQTRGAVSEDTGATRIIEVSELAQAKTVQPKKLGMSWTEGIPFASGILVIFFTMQYSILLAIVLGCATSLGLFFLFRLTRRYWRKISVKNEFSKDL